MKLILEADERPILLSRLGLPAKATNDQITAAVAERLTSGAPTPAAPQAAAIDHDLITAAVRDGRIPAYRADHYAARFAQDPEGTRALLARLTPGTAHYANAEHAAPPPTDYPREWLSQHEHGGSRVTVASD
jgi:hypothetical protein